MSPLGSASPSAKEAGRGGTLRLSGGERGLPLPLVRCDVSVRLYRKVDSDCTLSFEGSRYQVPRTLVGKRILIRFQEGVLRIFDGDRLVATHAQSPVKGRLVGGAAGAAGSDPGRPGDERPQVCLASQGQGESHP